MSERLYIPKLLALRRVQAYHRQELMNNNYDFHDQNSLKMPEYFTFYSSLRRVIIPFDQKANFSVSIRYDSNYN